MTNNLELKSELNKIDNKAVDDIVLQILSLNIDLKPRRLDEEIQTKEVKQKWLKDLLKNDPALFLEKWGKLINPSLLKHFEILKDDYEVSFYLKQLKHFENEKENKKNDKKNICNHWQHNISEKKIRNRRFLYTQKHQEYFTLEKLQERYPYEYEEYIGKYLPDEEKIENIPFSRNMSLVDRMYFDIDHNRMKDTVEEMIEKYGTIEEDNDSIMDNNSESNNSNSNSNENFSINEIIKKKYLYQTNEEEEEEKKENLRNKQVEEEEEDIIEEDDEDEEYNEETILKEIKRRQEQRKLELMKSNNNTNYPNILRRNMKNKKKIENKKNNNLQTSTTNNKKTDNQNTDFIKNNNTTSNINSVDKIFDIQNNDLDNNLNNGISEELKQQYYDEFIFLMKESFINGEDPIFDYSKIDYCEDYDDTDIDENDIHDKYFEEDI